MNRISMAMGAAFFAAAAIALAAHASEIPDHIAAAVADTARPENDTKRDAERKPGEVLAFAGIEPGDRVADLGPGQGYYTRILANAVGADGVVYAANFDWIAERFPQSADGLKALEGWGAHGNIRPLTVPMEAPSFPEALDIAFISLLYHDGHWQERDMARMNAAIFAALKPGGLYIVIDHVAEAGSGARDAGTLHRIDPKLVMDEVLAAGFVLDGESDVLANPEDDHTQSVFGDLRGRTDQFAYRFRKPVE